MQELVKGFIYPHGQVSVNGKRLNKYIVGMVLLTTEAIDDINSEGEFVVMGVNSPFRQQIGNITEALSFYPKYKPKYPLGDADQALLAVSNLTPEDLEPLK
jgi:hypothetical protein